MTDRHYTKNILHQYNYINIFVNQVIGIYNIRFQYRCVYTYTRTFYNLRVRKWLYATIPVAALQLT